MSVSVIIPTFNRPAELAQALHSLQSQRHPQFEILVVDNAASPAVENLVAEFNRAAKAPATYLPEPCLGLHHARHAGALAAGGDVLLFTDDDATFDPRWVEAYARTFDAHAGMAAAGGPVRPAWESPPPEWLSEFMGGTRNFPILSLMEPDEVFRVGPEEVFYGVNMAIRRDVLFELGGFNPEAFGDVWLGDGEAGLNRKLRERGMLIGYVPDAVAYHHIPPERMTAEYFCRRVANEGACAEYAALRAKEPGPLDLLRRLLLIFLSSARVGIVTPARFLARDRFALLKARMGLAYNLSRLRYVARLFHDRRLRELVAKRDWLEPRRG